MQENNAIEKKVIETAAKIFGKDPDTMNADTDLVKDLDARSINMVELVAMLEIQFDIELPGTIIKRAGTIGSLVKIINESGGKSIV